VSCIFGTESLIPFLCDMGEVAAGKAVDGVAEAAAAADGKGMYVLLNLLSFSYHDASSDELGIYRGFSLRACPFGQCPCGSQSAARSFGCVFQNRNGVGRYLWNNSL